MKLTPVLKKAKESLVGYSKFEGGDPSYVTDTRRSPVASCP